MNKLLVSIIAMNLLVHNACADDSLRLTKTYTGPTMSFEVPINAEVRFWAPSNSTHSLIDEEHHYYISWPVAGSTSEVFDLPDGDQLDIQPEEDHLLIMRAASWSEHGNIDRMTSDAMDFIPRAVSNITSILDKLSVEGDTPITLLSIETNSFKAGIFTGLEFALALSGSTLSNLTVFNYSLWDGEHCWIASITDIHPDGRQIAQDIISTCRLNNNVPDKKTE